MSDHGQVIFTIYYYQNAVCCCCKQPVRDNDIDLVSYLVFMDGDGVDNYVCNRTAGCVDLGMSMEESNDFLHLNTVLINENQ